MGCINSKEARRERNSIPRHKRQTIKENNANTEQQQVNAPPIVISKSHSSASLDSALYPSGSLATQQRDEKDEKPPVMIEERAQEHPCGETPADLNEVDCEANVKKVNPIAIVEPKTMQDPTILPATDLPEATISANEEEAGLLPTAPSTGGLNIPSDFSIIVRPSNGKGDMVIPIPHEEPYMTVKELKTNLPPHKNSKFFHLGRLLQDNYILIPAFIPKSDLHIVNISNRGVIQAMIS